MTDSGYNKFIYGSLLCTILCFAWSIQDKTHIYLPPEIIQELRPHAQACSKETGVPAIYMRNMMYAPLPDEEQVKKFLFCVCFNSGYADEDGHINVERMASLQLMNGTVDNYKDALRECNKVTLERNFDTMYAMGLCLHENTVFNI